MAIIKCSYDLLDDEEFFDLLMDSFDSVKEVGDEVLPGTHEGSRVKVLRVMSDEVPKEDVQISFTVTKIEGIKPFIYEFD